VPKEGTAPRASPYAGREFEVAVTLPPNYPHAAPLTVAFKAGTCHHPAVNKAGEVCHLLIKDTWSPTSSLYSLGALLQQNLAQPNAAHATEPDIMVELAENTAGFEAKARAAAATLPPAATP